ncbi:MAG: hypothetical protein HN590_15820, partial [Calditrichaeota bacterium]|nr:hypothetical protein [Calditrichota bacterium]
MRVIYFFICILIGATNLYSQPQLIFARTYDINGNEYFGDIYYTSENEYIAVGHRQFNENETSDFYIIKVDPEGNPIWANTYDRIGGNDRANTIIETDDGDFISGGSSNRFFAALRINSVGEALWFNSYASGSCEAIIELKAGDYLLAGYSNNQGYLICINGNGAVLWENDYGLDEHRDYLYSMRETEGGVVVAGYLIDNEVNTDDVWIIKVDFEGNLIWDRRIRSNTRQTSRSMISAPDEGFVFTGSERVRNDQLVLLSKIDDDGNLVWSRSYQFDFRFQYGTGLAKTREGDYLISGYVYDRDLIMPIMLKTNSQGVFRWSRIFDLREQLEIAPRFNVFLSTIIGENNSMVAAGHVNNTPNGLGQDGLIVKLGGEIQEPSFITWSPEDTVFTTVLGDTIDFWVQVADQQDDELSYLWLFNDQDILSRDTSAIGVFNDLGEQSVKCRVSDDEFTVEIEWRIIVQRFAVVGFTPDSLDMSIRRGSEVDFSVEARALEDVEIEYIWAFTDRNGQQEEVGDTENITIPFDLPGEYELQCFASNEDEVESVVWNINVQSVVWWWWPHENELSARQDTTFVFEVFPFNEESDSLEYLWLLGDDALESDTSFAEIQFPDVGDF